MKESPTKVLIVAIMLLIAAVPSFAQLRITMSLKAYPDPYLADWPNEKNTVIVTVTNPGPKTIAAKFDCQVYLNTVLEVNTKRETMQILQIGQGVTQFFAEDLVPFQNVKIVTGADKTAAKTGQLPEGLYEFCVSLIDPSTNAPLTQPVCKYFTLVDYQLPVLLEPQTGGTLTRSNRPMLRCTPVSPKYPTLVSYRFVVMEVLQGQPPLTAFRVNLPIMDVIAPTTQLLWAADIELPEKGKQYVWSVQALDQSGNPISHEVGKWAEPFTFFGCCSNDGGIDNLNDKKITLLEPNNRTEIDPSQPVLFSWTSLTGEKKYELKVVEMLVNQSGDQAIKENNPIIDKYGIAETTLQYPPSEGKLEEGKKYAWQISILSDNKVIGEPSSIFVFTTKKRSGGDTNKFHPRLLIVTPPGPGCTCPFSVDAMAPHTPLVFSTVMATPTSVCTGSTDYFFTATSTPSGPYTFEWKLTDPNGLVTTFLGSPYNFIPTIAGSYSLVVNSYDATPAICCSLTLYFNAVSPATVYTTLASSIAVCVGTASVISLSPAVNPTDFDVQWLISPAPCIAPTVADPTNLPGVTIDPASGAFSTPLIGWMALTGFTGSPYTTTASLKPGLYCFSCGIKSHVCATWVSSAPVQFQVFAPTVAGTLTLNPNQLCNDNLSHPITITVSGSYTATSWIWEYSNATTGNTWTPISSPPAFAAIGPVSITDNINVTTAYRVTFQNGDCPPVQVVATMSLRDPPPDGFICAHPDIQTSPSPGISSCVNPYPPCPTTWLPICSGCDAILTLTDAAGNVYPYTNTLTWDYLQAPYDYTTGIPPQYTNIVTPPPAIVSGAWTPTFFIGSTSMNTNSLTTTTWFRAVAHDPTGACPDKIFYCVVIVIIPPPPPVISPLGPIITCTVPVSQTISLQSPYTPDGFALQYMWSPDGTWQPFPVQPFVATDYGAYSLIIKNECGESQSAEFIIAPEDIPVTLQGPCCVCEGKCGIITATDIPGLTYLWTCDDPNLTLNPNNTSAQIQFCPTKPLTIFTLIVTNADGCILKLQFEVKVCPQY